MNFELTNTVATINAVSLSTQIRSQQRPAALVDRTVQHFVRQYNETSSYTASAAETRLTSSASSSWLAAAAETATAEAGCSFRLPDVVAVSRCQRFRKQNKSKGLARRIAPTWLLLLISHRLQNNSAVIMATPELVLFLALMPGACRCVVCRAVNVEISLEARHGDDQSQLWPTGRGDRLCTGRRASAEPRAACGV